ncbi:MAG: antitoxin Xre/MbcA/ParS toxin-binding domain-containing protein [Chitinophagaceae bacterium]
MPEEELNIESQLNQEIYTVIKHSDANNQFFADKDTLTFNDFLSNRLSIIFLIREGVPYSLFSLIQLYTPFSEKDWSKFLDISIKSLQRYKQSAKQFKSLQSEKIIEMAEVTNIGLEVFGDSTKFKLWLDTPNFALGGVMPMELLKDSYGKEMVVGELTRINYGILS